MNCYSNLGAIFAKGLLVAKKMGDLNTIVLHLVCYFNFMIKIKKLFIVDITSVVKHIYWIKH